MTQQNIGVADAPSAEIEYTTNEFAMPACTLSFTYGQETHLGLQAIEQDPVSGRYLCRVRPEETEVGPNIREMSEEHVWDLAHSIARQGQLQECIADICPITGEVRVWAGQHRRLAILLINSQPLDDHGEEIFPISDFPIRVSVYPGQFTTEQILRIQIDENLQHKMKPEEKAVVLQGLYQLYLSIEDHETTVTDFARMTGRGISEIRAALKLGEALPEIKQLLEGGSLTYGIAVAIASLPEDKQMNAAKHIIAGNLGTEAALTYINGLILEDLTIGLFSSEELSALGSEDFKLTYRTTMARAAQDAIGYLHRVLRLIELLPEGEQIQMTQSVRQTIAKIIVAGDNFMAAIEELDPNIAKQIHELTT